MPINTDSLNKDLYKLLKVRGYRPIPKDSTGQTSPIPDDADVFKFTYATNGQPHGTAWVTIDGKDVIVYYDDDITKSTNEDMDTDPTRVDDSWTGFLQTLKTWAQRRQLGFDLKNQDHLSSDMAQRDHMKKEENIQESTKKDKPPFSGGKPKKGVYKDEYGNVVKPEHVPRHLARKGREQAMQSKKDTKTVNESYYALNKKASYSDNVPNVKIIIQHTRQIEEGEQRFRNVERIFLENTNGERFLAPTIRPGIARVYARHIAEGGVPNDERWNHIKSLCEEYGKMAGFVRAVRNHQFNESAQRLVNEGVNHYISLREMLGRMTGHRGYNNYFESWTPTLMETESDTTNLNELFVQETVDPRIESVMPILSRLHKNISETEIKEVNELEEWTDNIIDEATDLKSIPENEPVNEGKMSEVDALLHDIVDGNVELSQVMNHPNGKVEGYVSKMLQDMYDEISSTQGLHPDDDFEEIESRIHDELANEYGKSDSESHNTEDSSRAGSGEMIGRGVGTGLGAAAGGYLAKSPAGVMMGAEIGGDIGGNIGAGIDRLIDKKSSKTQKEVDENLDSNQKKSGQVGPTEKTKSIGTVIGSKKEPEHPFADRLVGANESVDVDIEEDWKKKAAIGALGLAATMGGAGLAGKHVGHAIGKEQARFAQSITDKEDQALYGKSKERYDQAMANKDKDPKAAARASSAHGTLRRELAQKYDINESAYGDGYGDGYNDHPESRRASEIYSGTEIDQYSKGYDAGQKARKEEQGKRVAKLKADMLPYERMSDEELNKRQEEIKNRLNQIYDIYHEYNVKRGVASFDPKLHAPANHEGLKTENNKLNDELNLITRVLAGRKHKPVKKEEMAEGFNEYNPDKSVDYTLGHSPDTEYVYSIFVDGKKEGTYHSLEQVKQIVRNKKKTNPDREYKVKRRPRDKMAGPVGQLPEQNMMEGVEDKIKKHNAAVAKQPGGQAHRANHPDILKTAPKGYSFTTSHKLVKKEEVAEEKINEMDSEGYKGHRGDEDPGKGPEKYVKHVKAKDAEKDAEKELNKTMDKAYKKDVKEGQDILEAIKRLMK